MTINKTASGNWRVRVEIGRDHNGKRLRKTGTFTTKREAKAAEHMWSELARTDVILREQMGFTDFVETVYLPDVQVRVRWNTYRAYTRDARIRLEPSFKNLPLDRITHEKIQRMIDSCSSYKVATNARDTLRQILNIAVEKSYIRSNPATDKYSMPKREVYPTDHNGDWLTSFAAHDDFIAKIDNNLYKVIAVLGLSLGLRKGEIFGLDWEDVDFERRLVHIQRTYVKESTGHVLLPPKTKMSDRYIPLRKTSSEWLYSLWEQRGKPTGAICVNTLGSRANPSVVAYKWTKYLKKHGLPYVTILNMRHSFATACLMAGMEISKVSRYLGHTSISTTAARYVRYKADDLVADFDRFVV